MSMSAVGVALLHEIVQSTEHVVSVGLIVCSSNSELLLFQTHHHVQGRTLPGEYALLAKPFQRNLNRLSLCLLLWKVAVASCWEHVTRQALSCS